MSCYKNSVRLALTHIIPLVSYEIATGYPRYTPRSAATHAPGSGTPPVEHPSQKLSPKTKIRCKMRPWNDMGQKLESKKRLQENYYTLMQRKHEEKAKTCHGFFQPFDDCEGKMIRPFSFRRVAMIASGSGEHRVSIQGHIQLRFRL